jgi:quinol-cytochrome oxidoreductase complex cytochrome b subunit
MHPCRSSSAKSSASDVRKLLIASTATFAVLVATGLYQAFRYFPREDSSASTVHRWSAYLLVALLLATAVVHAMRTRPTLTMQASAWSMANVAVAVAAVAVVAGIVTGPMLQWDQLALSAVTVDKHIDGVFWSENVKFILRGSEELGLSEFRRDVWLHILVFPLIAAGGLGALWYACTRRSSSTALSESEQSEEEVSA